MELPDRGDVRSGATRVVRHRNASPALPSVAHWQLSVGVAPAS